MLAVELLNREFTPIAASHNLRELDGISGDHVGLLHRGGILLSENLEEMKFHTPEGTVRYRKSGAGAGTAAGTVSGPLGEKRGSMLLLVARGTRREISERVESKHPVFWEVLPLSLEEIFISETEVTGYDKKNIRSLSCWRKISGIGAG